jgi:hypothetical protein
MVKWLIFWVFAVVALASCGGAGGHAERVDVPLSVTVTLAQKARSDCHQSGCLIHYRAVVIDQGSQPVYARDCVISGLDSVGRVIFQTPVSLGFPAGGYTAPGSPFHEAGSLPKSISQRDALELSKLSASCSAYVWHGTPPI